MRFSVGVICAALFCVFLTGCGSSSDRGLLDVIVDPAQHKPGPSPLVTGDPKGPIPDPAIPQDLAALAKEHNTAPDAKAKPEAGKDSADSTREDAPYTPPKLSYTLKVVTPDEAPELAAAFENACLLNRLADKPVSSVAGLTQRLRSDMQTAKDVLHAYGYYAGTAHGRITPQEKASTQKSGGDTAQNTQEEPETVPDAYVVTVTFRPGEQYTVGRTAVNVKDPSLLPPDAQGVRRNPLETLDDVGLPVGAPATSDKVLDATGRVREQFRDKGYPYAAVANTRYTVDHDTKALEADVLVDSGERVLMGPLEATGAERVSGRYLEALQTWRRGMPWNQTRIENYRDKLRQSGLFSAAEIRPGDETLHDGVRAVVAELTPAPERTIGGALKYDSDFGPGVLGYWEHRNLTGNGDTLRIDMPIWKDLQEIYGHYRLPFFLRNDQDLIATGGVLSEESDAYDLQSMHASIGVERRFSRRWQGSLSVMGEGGDLKTPDEPRHKYLMTGLPVTATYSNANSLLDATKGFRLKLAAAPYIGSYDKEFSALRARVEGNAYLPLVGSDRLVLALRGMYGVLAGSKANEVPASIRFYTGGGGSVRGYAYQSLGPRNSSRDPLGGASAVEFSTEARMKFTDTFGLVAFLDGGMVYDDQTPDFGEEMRLGAGVGLRLYTAIGPVRFDVATPLNARDDDKSVQIYFSIGQSF